jgi:hypothetical protein
MPLLFHRDIVAIWKKTKKEYDFLQYTATDLRWHLINAPTIQGVQLVHNHSIVTRHSPLHLSNGKQINITVSCRILKHTDDYWIPVLYLQGSRLVNTGYTIVKHSDLIEVEAPTNLSLGVWQTDEEPAPIPTNTNQFETLFSQSIPESIKKYIDESLCMHYVPSILLYVTTPDLTPEQKLARFGAIYMASAFHTVKQYEIHKKLPKHIAQVVATDAKQRCEICPISMEDINDKECTVTSCFHVFDRDSIAIWHEQNNTCPVCKQLCSLTIIDSS